MKLATFLVDDGSDQKLGPELGIVTPDGILSISRALPGIAASMEELIERWPDIEAELRAIERTTETIPIDTVRFLPPIRHPQKILAMGLNYADHIKESGLPTPEHQVWFNKLPGTVSGPFDPIDVPKVSDKLDYEAELVAVIGRGGRHIEKSDAPAAVFGYCVGNDVSVRDWQLQTPQWMLGKSFDGHGPFGPWITTSDEVGDPHRLEIRCWVNGELRQHSNTRYLIFNVWDQVEHLSKAMRLNSGDLIFTGTPSGVGWAMDPPKVLQPGDTVRCEIDELGAIESTVRPEA